MLRILKVLILLILVCLFPLTNAWSEKAPKDETVYTQKYDKKIYHREWCPTLKLFKNKTTVGKATAQGYVPCSYCKPPVISSSNFPSGNINKTAVKSTRVGSSPPLYPPKNAANPLMKSVNLEFTNCPARYFNGREISSSDFNKVNDFIANAGKEKIVIVMYREKPNMTIRKNDSFVQTFGRPSTSFVDECTIMYDLISLSLTLQTFKSKVHEHDKHLVLIEKEREAERKRRIKRQEEIERLARLEADREAERKYQERIAEEEADREQEAKRQEAKRQEAKRQAEWEAEWQAEQEAKRQTARKASSRYKLFGIVDSEFVKTCHDSIHLQAKNSARIVSAHVSSANDRLMLNGKAQLQTGYGAWKNYSYACIDGYGSSSTERTDAGLQEGWETAIAAENFRGTKVLDLE